MTAIPSNEAWNLYYDGMSIYEVQVLIDQQRALPEEQRILKTSMEAAFVDAISQKILAKFDFATTSSTQNPPSSQAYCSDEPEPICAAVAILARRRSSRIHHRPFVRSQSCLQQETFKASVEHEVPLKRSSSYP